VNLSGNRGPFFFSGQQQTVGQVLQLLPRLFERLLRLFPLGDVSSLGHEQEHDAAVVIDRLQEAVAVM
jgi:hypothetical protein